MRQYGLRVLIAFDQLINTIAGGYPNETVSARAWRLGKLQGGKFWTIVQEVTDFTFQRVDPNHCEGSYLYCKNPEKTCGIYFPVYCDNCKQTHLSVDHGFEDIDLTEPSQVTDDVLDRLRAIGI